MPLRSSGLAARYFVLDSAILFQTSIFRRPIIANAKERDPLRRNGPKPELLLLKPIAVILVRDSPSVGGRLRLIAYNMLSV
jgi:hypothetical protein